MVKSVIELDACLTDLRARYDNFVYHLSASRGFRNLDIVNLAMVNIVLTLCLFAPFWAGSCI